LPIGAFISSKEIMHSLTHDPVLGHITTFGGNAVCAAAANANLQIIIRDKLWENASRQGELFRELLVHDKIRSIRGKGLLLAAEFESFDENKLIIDRLIEKGIVTDWFLFAPNCLRIAPPLIISDEQTREACKIIIETLDDIF
jgi:acetylornithine/succinyldiaminopimelate/putrescine aminotransferase